MQTEKALGCGGEVRVQEVSDTVVVKGTWQGQAGSENPGLPERVARSAG